MTSLIPDMDDEKLSESRIPTNGELRGINETMTLDTHPKPGDTNNALSKETEDSRTHESSHDALNQEVVELQVRVPCIKGQLLS